MARVVVMCQRWLMMSSYFASESRVLLGLSCVPEDVSTAVFTGPTLRWGNLPLGGSKLPASPYIPLRDRQVFSGDSLLESRIALKFEPA